MKTKLLLECLIAAGILATYPGCFTHSHHVVAKNCVNGVVNCTETFKATHWSIVGGQLRDPTCQPSCRQKTVDPMPPLPPAPQQPMQMIPAPTTPIPRTSYYRGFQGTTAERPVPVQHTLPNGKVIQLWEWEGQLYIRLREGNWYNFYPFHEPYEQRRDDD